MNAKQTVIHHEEPLFNDSDEVVYSLSNLLIWKAFLTREGRYREPVHVCHGLCSRGAGRERERLRERERDRERLKELSMYNIHLIRSRPRNFSIREGNERKKFEGREEQRDKNVEDNLSFFATSASNRRPTFVKTVSLCLCLLLSFYLLSLFLPFAPFLPPSIRPTFFI